MSDRELEARAYKQANNGRWDLFMVTMLKIKDGQCIKRLVEFQQRAYEESQRESA